MARTNEEIEKQVNGLIAMKDWLPEYSRFGTANWEKIDTQVNILKGVDGIEDIEGEDAEPDTPEYDIYQAAVEADEWLQGNTEDDLFETK